MNLFVKIINKLFLFRLYPLGIRIFSFIFFIFLMVVAFSGKATGQTELPPLERTNLANLIVWGFWWPGIILTAIVFGRIWCIACPIEMLTTLCSKFGLKHKTPGFMLTGWPMAILYCLVLFIGVGTFEIDHYPVRMALYLVCLLLFSIVSGLIFEKNTFCRCLCPVGRLLGLHARFAAFTWKVRHPEICVKCKDHSCVAKSNAYKLEGRSCGVGLLPSKLDDNTECILCGQCMKACAMNNPGIAGRPNPVWSIRKFASDILRMKPVQSSDAFFLMIISGFILNEVFSEWTGQETLLMYIPQVLRGVLPTFIHGKLIEICVLMIIYPLVLWIIPYILFKISRGKMGFVAYMRESAILLLPIIVIVHGCIAILEINAALPYMPLAVGDFAGVNTAASILSGSVSPMNPVFNATFLVVILFMSLSASIALSIFLSICLQNRIISENKLALTSFYLVSIIYGGVMITPVIIRIFL